jgi:LCP family protein required for cell wall assembly
MYEPPEERPYKTYRSAPRGLVARLRGESDTEQLEIRAEKLSRQAPAGGGGRGGADGRGGAGGGGGRGRGGRGDGDGRGGAGGAGGGGAGGGQLPGRRRSIFRRRAGLPRRPRFHPIRVIKYVVYFLVFWVLLSAVLFFISASDGAGNLPDGSATEAALSSSGPMLLSANNILILGLDNRPTSGYSSDEGGANHDEADANTDSIMIWRLGGGVSRRLSIARDTLVDLPGRCGEQKINAAWSCGGPQETIHAVEKLTGVEINHLIVVDLGNFPKFIDDIGGVTVKTPRICSKISGGVADGGFTLNLSPGYHHLDGTNALTLARTRENSCDPSYDDFNRQKMQQEILNAIKSQLFSAHAFIHLPWAAWDAPRVIQTDMGPLDLMQMFVSSEIGGSAPARVLKETGSYYNGEDVQLPNAGNVQSEVNTLMNGS